MLPCVCYDLAGSGPSGRAVIVMHIRLVLILLIATGFAVPSSAAPDEPGYGKSQGYPLGTTTTWWQQPYLVGSMSRFDALFDFRRVPPSPKPRPLSLAEQGPDIQYSFGSERRSIQRYLDENPTTGLLILKDGRILFEAYQYDRTEQHRFTSFSMAKTITSMLVGIAIRDGAIRSIDDRSEAYVPELKGTVYGETPLRHLLTMSSGVAFTEDYSGTDDVTRLWRNTLLKEGPGGPAAVTPFNHRARPPGEKFYYASAETQVLGLVLRAATRAPVADYLAAKLWQPMGAEAEATWNIDAAGQEATYCCLNALLRDYARLGLLLAYDGARDGREIIPRDWVLAATTPSDSSPHLKPGTATRFFGYGYQTWIFPDADRQFALLGVRGQTIFVHPRSKLVLVHTAVRRQSRDPGGAETVALWRALVQVLGN
jgi:CubicO group peptidase (beta-lactamase class C family)